MDEETTNLVHAGIVMAGVFACCIMGLLFFSSSMTFLSSSLADSSNIASEDNIFGGIFPDIIPNQKSFAQNESYLKRAFDGYVNYDQISMNRGVDFTKCYSRDVHELQDVIRDDTHYIKIRGDTPDEALKTISLPSIMLNAGFSIPDPSQMYVSEFKQVSPDEYKLWIITKKPAVETIDGALESSCRVSYYY
jgi:hypothetical protein